MNKKYYLLLIISALLTLCHAGLSISLANGQCVNLYGKQYALVIGNSEYTNGWSRLPNAVKDAQEVSTKLRSMGFEVIEKYDLTSEQFKSALSDFVYTYGNNDDTALLLYFAGHGETETAANDEKLGYIIPVDAPLITKDLAGFSQKAISMLNIQEYSLKVKAKHVLMLFDSCFSGSIFTLRSEQVPPIIDDKIQSKVRQYITSGGEDESVPDKSYFKTCLLQGLDGYADLNKDNYVTGIELGNYLKDNVVNYSNKTQHPQYGTINDPKLDKGDFVFAMNTDVKPLAQIITHLKPATQVSVVKEDATGSIKVESNRAGEIYLDGKSLTNLSSGQAITLNTITPGDHNLELHYTGKTESKKLYVFQNQTTQVSFKIIAPPPAGMVYVEGGTFIMGDTAGRGESYEKPNHQVTLSAFYLGKYEVTQQQWQEVMSAKPSHFKGDNLPVEQVSWYDCVEFCNKLSQIEGLTPCYSGNGKQLTCNWSANGYRLPTEAEWEYAAKGGKLSKGYKYSGSNDIENVAWYDNNSDRRTHTVGGRQANELGLYDMNGNVYEWCWDLYDNYTSNNQTNPHGSSSGINRVLRGGSWSVDGFNCRAANEQGSPGERNENFGFRIIRISQ